MMKKLLPLILLFCFITTTAQAALIDNLVSYWKLDEASGNAADAHGVNTGTVDGADYSQAGKINTAFGFVLANTDFVNVGNDSSLDIGTSDFSISAWYKSTYKAGYQAIFHKWGSAGYDLYIMTGGLRFYAELDDGTFATYDNGSDESEITDGEWHHVTATFDRSGDVTFYLDGGSIGTADISARSGSLTNTKEAHIGMHENEIVWPFDGTIDEVGIWDRALSADEVKDLYNATKGLAYNFDGVDDIVHRVVSHWKLDDDLPTDAVLDAHDANDGTVVNDGDNQSDEQSTATAKIVRAFDFDGSNDYVTTGDPIIDIANAFSVSVWINPNSFGTQDAIWSKYDGGGDGILLRRDEATALDVWLSNASIQLQTTVNDGSWYHVVVTHDGDNTSVYINDSLDGATPVNRALTEPPTGGFDIGYSSLGKFDGIIDEVTIWNRAITSTEITSLYNGGSGLAYPFTPAVGGVIKTYNGLAWASVKTINGLAVANVKTINGAAAQ